MVSLGRIAAPKPINLPSQRRENNGEDPNVSLVPKGSHTWNVGGADVGGPPPNAMHSALVHRPDGGPAWGGGPPPSYHHHQGVPPPPGPGPPGSRPSRDDSFPNLGDLRDGIPASYDGPRDPRVRRPRSPEDHARDRYGYGDGYRDDGYRGGDGYG